MPKRMVTCTECQGKGKVKAPPKRQSRADRAADIASRLDNLKQEVEDLSTEVQDQFDNMPENFQGGERGQILEGAVEELGSASDQIDEAKTTLEAVSFS